VTPAATTVARNGRPAHLVTDGIHAAPLLTPLGHFAIPAITAEGRFRLTILKYDCLIAVPTVGLPEVEVDTSPPTSLTNETLA